MRGRVIDVAFERKLLIELYTKELDARARAALLGRLAKSSPSEQREAGPCCENDSRSLVLGLLRLQPNPVFLLTDLARYALGLRGCAALDSKAVARALDAKAAAGFCASTAKAAANGE